jgi:hypothetical protein
MFTPVKREKIVYSVSKEGWLYSSDDPNSGNPNTPMVRDIFYAARAGRLEEIMDFVAESPSLVNAKDRFGTI